MTNLDSILKSRDITLLTKICLVKAMVFPVVLVGCESWIIRKAERRRIDVFELWCWRRLLRVLWTSRRSNQSILKELSLNIHRKGWCWSWSSIIWLPDVKNWLTGKDLDAGKDWRQEEKGKTQDEVVGWHHQLDGHEFEQALGISDEQGSLTCCSPWGCKEPDMSEELNWTDPRSKSESVWVKRSRSVVSNSLRPRGLYPTRLLCPWDFPGNSTGVDCHFLLQGIFPTQGLNLGLPHWR